MKKNRKRIKRLTRHWQVIDAKRRQSQMQDVFFLFFAAAYWRVLRIWGGTFSYFFFKDFL